MEVSTKPRELRKLKGPQGVQKSTATSNQPQDKKMACQACHERKKRCIPVAAQRRCQYCLQENQRCLPRERLNRYVQRSWLPFDLGSWRNWGLKLTCQLIHSAVEEEPQKAKEKDQGKQQEKEQEKEKEKSKSPRRTYNLPLPRGIDHEVPRWSAVYSMFAEVLNLIPPEEDEMTTSDDEEGEGDKRPQKSRKTAHQNQSRDQADIVDSISGSENDNENQNPSSLAMQKLLASGKYNVSPLDRDFRIPANGHFHEGFTMYDMDALLRF